MSIRVLLVEDLKPATELMTELLHFIGGFKIVGRCATEQSALQWLRGPAGGADLVLLDLMLREGSGFSVLQSGAVARTPTVVFSDFASPVVAQRCLALGAVAAIPKSDYRSLRSFLQSFRSGGATPLPA